MSTITSRSFSQSFAPLPRLNVPRGARVVAALFLSASQLMSRLLHRPRSANFAAAGRNAQEAQAVRSLAQRWERSDPGFAADLYAAAARHEGLAD